MSKPPERLAVLANTLEFEQINHNTASNNLLDFKRDDPLITLTMLRLDVNIGLTKAPRTVLLSVASTKLFRSLLKHELHLSDYIQPFERAASLDLQADTAFDFFASNAVALNISPSRILTASRVELK